MVVRVRPSVVAGGMVRVGQLDREPAADEGFKALVDGRQGDGGKLPTDGPVYLFRGGVGVGAREEVEHGCALLGEPLAGRFQRGAKNLFRLRRVHRYITS